MRIIGTSYPGLDDAAPALVESMHVRSPQDRPRPLPSRQHDYRKECGEVLIQVTDTQHDYGEVLSRVT